MGNEVCTTCTPEEFCAGAGQIITELGTLAKEPEHLSTPRAQNAPFQNQSFNRLPPSNNLIINPNDNQMEMRASPPNAGIYSPEEFKSQSFTFPNGSKYFGKFFFENY